jgi:hypothetical protein
MCSGDLGRGLVRLQAARPEPGDLQHRRDRRGVDGHRPDGAVIVTRPSAMRGRATPLPIGSWNGVAMTTRYTPGTIGEPGTVLHCVPPLQTTRFLRATQPIRFDSTPPGDSSIAIGRAAQMLSTPLW